MFIEKIKIDLEEEITRYTFGFIFENKKELKNIWILEDLIINLFDITQNEKSIINFLKRKETFEFKSEYKKLDLIILENYLISYHSKLHFITKQSKSIRTMTYEKIPLSKARELAIQNLTYTVQNENLSLGDKKIIKDIALKTLDANLKRSQDPQIEEIGDYADCVRTDLSEWARDQLLSYGFKYQHPYIEDFKLNP